MNFTSFIFLSNRNEETFEFPFTDVIYPIDVLNEDNHNTSILYYFTRKDELKSIDDMKSMERKHKSNLTINPSKTFIRVLFNT